MAKHKNQNQREQNKRLFHPVVVTAVLMILLLAGNAFGSVLITGATESAGSSRPVIPAPTGTPQQISEQVVNGCVTTLTAYADPEFEKYKIFMEDNFKNKSTTSSLLDLGVQRYDLFKADIYNRYQDLVGQQIDLAAANGLPSADQGVALNDCNLLALGYVDDAGKLLQMRAITTSNIKKASIFVEKYKQINDKLRALNLDVMRMVVNISAFQQKLPCYLKSCA
jgi:hypothetical protein